MNSLSPVLLNEQVFNIIKQSILENKFSPNQRLNEVEFSKSLGVSRGPIREAFQKLANEGLVNLIPNKGAHVVSFTLKEVNDLYEIRENLELITVKLCIQKANKSDYRKLSDSLEATRQILKKNKRTSYPWEFDFHINLAECTGNKYLVEYITKLSAQMRLIRHRSASRRGRGESALEEHVEIFKALREKNLKKAERLMINHFYTSKKNILKIFDENKINTKEDINNFD